MEINTVHTEKGHIEYSIVGKRIPVLFLRVDNQIAERLYFKKNLTQQI